MLPLFLSQAASLFAFNSQVIPPGTLLTKYFDTTQGALAINLSLTECSDPCELHLYAFEEVRREQIFSKQTDFQAVCCNSTLGCPYGQVHFADSAPVSHRSILPLSEELDDGLLAKTVTLSNAEIILQRDTDIRLTKGLWTVIIANCGKDPATVDGETHVKRRDGTLDSRLQLFSIISIIQTAASVLILGYFLYTWLRTQPKLSMDHNKIILSISLVAVSGAISVMLFYNWNKSGHIPLIYQMADSVIRSVSIIFAYYVTLSQLQRPHDIPFLLFVLALMPMTIGCFLENRAISDFSIRSEGKWLFGFGEKISVEFLIIVIVHAGAAYYAYTHKPTESVQNDRRKKFLGLFVSSLSSYICMSLALLVWRLGLNLIETRKSEWVPYSLRPMLLVFICVLNGWYMGDLNPEGWQTLDSLGNNNDYHGAEAVEKTFNEDEDGTIPPLPLDSSSDEAVEFGKAD